MDFLWSPASVEQLGSKVFCLNRLPLCWSSDQRAGSPSAFFVCPWHFWLPASSVPSLEWIGPEENPENSPPCCSLGLKDLQLLSLHISESSFNVLYVIPRVLICSQQEEKYFYFIFQKKNVHHCFNGHFLLLVRQIAFSYTRDICFSSSRIACLFTYTLCLVSKSMHYIFLQYFSEFSYVLKNICQFMYVACIFQLCYLFLSLFVMLVSYRVL